jgi:flagellar hook-associated protein 2
LNTVSFASGTATSGTFSINGISISVDATTDTLADVLARINDSDAQVTASYDSSSDTIRVVSDTLGSRTVQFTAGTSNFLTVTNLTAATQDAGDDAQFTINGGSTQTRNTNQVSDAIGDVTLNFLSTGTSTVTVEGDDDTIVERVNDFVTAFNNAITQIETLTGRNGVLGGDGSLQVIENYLRDTIFSQVSGITGDFASLVDIGITTGTAFDAEAITQLQLDETEFREALRTDRLNVRDLFTNTGETGVADLLSDYLNEVTTVTGFLNDRVKTRGSIDSQILLYNDRILRLEDRVEKRELRLRAQFTRLEQLSAGFQSQNSTLSSLILNFRQF